MKKVIVKPVREEAKYFCDRHPRRECYSELKTMSWYGSKFDMLSAEIHLCDECLEELYRDLKLKFKVEIKDIII